MSLLSTIKTGRIEQPHMLILYGADGTGKTTLAAGAPAPIFIGTESTGTVDVARFPVPSSFYELLEQLTALITDPHDYKSLVLDSLDWVEPLVFDDVCKEQSAKSIEDIGYAKGYEFALPRWARLIKGLNALRTKRSMNIILLAHAQVKAFNDPEQMASYDRYLLKLHHKAASLLRESVDEVLFIRFETNVVREKKGAKAFAAGDGSRVIYTENRPAFDAKNRHDLPFEIELPRSTGGSKNWETLAAAYAKAESKRITPSPAEKYKPTV